MEQKTWRHRAIAIKAGLGRFLDDEHRAAIDQPERQHYASLAGKAGAGASGWHFDDDGGEPDNYGADLSGGDGDRPRTDELSQYDRSDLQLQYCGCDRSLGHAGISLGRHLHGEDKDQRGHRRYGGRRHALSG